MSDGDETQIASSDSKQNNFKWIQKNGMKMKQKH